MKEKTEW